MSQLEQYLILFGVVTTFISFAIIVSLVTENKMLRRGLADSEAARSKVMTWLATNLGEHGDFERSPDNHNVIQFRRKH